MAMQDNKGGGNLAQSFLGNTATQATPMPQIARPNTRFTAPQIQMPQAPIQQQAPQMGPTTQWTHRGRPIDEAQAKRMMHGIGSASRNQRGDLPIRQIIQAAQQAPVQQAPQPRESQLLAEAINRRAMARSGGR